ncbi:MAG: hypothetical protein K6B46_03290 [Opitutales bacterium]|nr:hypothetical protein [Opitutales bacterium]
MYSKSVILFVAASLFASFAGTAFAGKFMKNASVGGYRIIVEGGGVEKRKEVQYDAHGNIVFSTSNVDLRQLQSSTAGLDDSLLGEDFNLDPMAGGAALEELGVNDADVPAVNAGALDLPIVDLGGEPETVAGTPEPDTKPRSRKKLSSPWVATREIRKKQLEFAAQERKRLAEEAAKKSQGELWATAEDTGEIMLDPSANMIEPLKTEDGRDLPFFLSGSGIHHSESVDGTASLKNYTKMNESLGGNAESFDREFALESNENYDKIISFDQWHSKFSSLGQKRFDGVPESPSFLQKIFGGNDKRFERKQSAVGGTWENNRQTEIRVNESFAKKMLEQYRQTKAFSTELLLPSPEQGGISMQGINRYLFRRSHSDEPGLPFIKPGNDKVEIKKQ